MVDMEESSVDDEYPKNFRRCHISTLNHSVHLESTYPNENMDYLVNMAYMLLEKFKEVKEEGIK